MKAQCSICVELFEKDSQIAATTCGHIFHYDCLFQWLHSQRPSTCPTCRSKCQPEKNVVSPLYLDYNDDQTVDQSKLENDLDAAKLAIREKEKERQEIIESKKLCEQKITALEKSKREIENLYAGEKAIVKELHKDLLYYKNQIEEAQIAKKEASKAMQKLKTLQNVQTIINDCQSDITEMLNGQPSSNQLATWCSVLQKELRTKKAECKQSSKEIQNLKKSVHQQKDMLKQAMEQARVAESAAQSLEKQNESLKKRLEKLSKAIASPSDSKGSFINRMINESPFPLPPDNKRPRLTAPLDDSLDMNVTMELFTDDEDGLKRVDNTQSVSAEVKPSPSTKAKQDCKEYGTTFLKISSAASSSAKQRANVGDTNVPGIISTSGLFKQRNMNKQQSAVFREGYNGFGTHDTFIQPLARPAGVKMPKKTTSSAFKMSLKVAPRSQGKAPPLPSLQGFLSQ